VLKCCYSESTTDSLIITDYIETRQKWAIRALTGVQTLVWQYQNTGARGDAPGYINIVPKGLARVDTLAILISYQRGLPGAVPLAALISYQRGLLGRYTGYWNY